MKFKNELILLMIDQLEIDILRSHYMNLLYYTSTSSFMSFSFIDIVTIDRLNYDSCNKNNFDLIWV